jgi:hypothetical protein
MICKACNTDLLSTDFYKNNLTTCKKCILEKAKKRYMNNENGIKEYIKKWRSKNVEMIIKRSKDYREKNKNKIREYYRNWYLINGRKRTAKDMAYIKNWMLNHKKQVQVGQKLHSATRSGRIIKKNECEKCGTKNIRLHGHHKNYNRPYDVTWLCASCHKLEHNNIDKRVLIP